MSDDEHGDRACTFLRARADGRAAARGDDRRACLRRAVERFPEREALVCAEQGFRATYAELWELVDLAARGLLARGIEKGDRVGIWAPNRFEWVVTQYAAARAGAVLVNVNPAYKATRARARAATRSASGCSFTRAASGRRTTASCWTRSASAARRSSRCSCSRTAGTTSSRAAPASSEAELEEREATLSPDEPVNIQFTSGTTGLPKGATLSHRNILNNGYFNGLTLRYTEHDRICVPVPFYHCFGCVMGNLGAVTHGACVVVPSEAFDPLAVLDAVSRERCTSLYGVPTMFIAALEEPRFAEFDLSSLRTGIMAGAPCPIEVMKRVRADMHMDEVTIACGMTETSPVSTQTAVDDPLEKRVSTIGRAHPHVEVKIVDPVTGETVPRGVPGRAVHPWLQRHARLLGRRRGDRERDRRRRLDAHRRSLDDGRGRLRQHRRPDQGHDHPRRREHLPARDRGVPAHPRRDQRRVRDRRPERALRRRGDGVGEAPRRARGDARGADRGLPREDRDATRSRATGSSSTRSR